MSDEIYVPIVKMYQAARQGIPGQADDLALIAGRLASIVDALDVQTAKAGDPQALRDALTVATLIYDGIRCGVDTLNHAAVALELTSDDYVEQDTQAAGDFRSWHGALKNIEVTRIRVPGAIGSPESPGAVVAGTIGPGLSYPTDVTPSDYDPTTPGEDDADRDETESDDSAELGLPYDPTEQYR